MNKHKILFHIDRIFTSLFSYERRKIWFIDCLRLLITLLILIPLTLFFILINWVKNTVWWLIYDLKKHFRTKNKTNAL